MERCRELQKPKSSNRRFELRRVGEGLDEVIFPDAAFSSRIPRAATVEFDRDAEPRLPTRLPPRHSRAARDIRHYWRDGHRAQSRLRGWAVALTTQTFSWIRLL